MGLVNVVLWYALTLITKHYHTGWVHLRRRTVEPNKSCPGAWWRLEGERFIGKCGVSSARLTSIILQVVVHVWEIIWGYRHAQRE